MEKYVAYNAHDKENRHFKKLEDAEAWLDDCDWKDGYPSEVFSNLSHISVSTMERKGTQNERRQNKILPDTRYH